MNETQNRNLARKESIWMKPVDHTRQKAAMVKFCKLSNILFALAP
jgi:hypothetical protein